MRPEKQQKRAEENAAGRNDGPSSLFPKDSDTPKNFTGQLIKAGPRQSLWNSWWTGRAFMRPTAG